VLLTQEMHLVIELFHHIQQQLHQLIIHKYGIEVYGYQQRIGDIINLFVVLNVIQIILGILFQIVVSLTQEMHLVVELFHHIQQ
jgi:hypothetical protein